MRRLALTFGLLSLALAGCSGTIPVEYRPQSFITIPGASASMGDFEYAPAKSGGLSPNQLQNTAAGSIYIGEDVATYVRRATALEMQKAGVDIAEGNGRAIEGEVLELMADDLGYSVDWSYAITYRVVEAGSKRELFSKTYRPEPRKTGKFGNPSDYTPSVNLLILDAAEQFMADIKREGALGSAVAMN